MAINTETKRRAAQSTPWAPTFPVPDGTVAVADRFHVAGFYYTAPVPLTAVDQWTAIGATRVLTAVGAPRILTVIGAN